MPKAVSSGVRVEAVKTNFDGLGIEVAVVSYHIRSNPSMKVVVDLLKKTIKVETIWIP